MPRNNPTPTGPRHSAAPRSHSVTPSSHPVIPANAGISARLLTRIDAVLHGCLPGQPERLAALDAAIRAPLPLSTGVGVLGAGDAAPTGVVAGLLADVLAARRPHRVLAVTAGSRQAQPAGTGSRQARPTVEAEIARRAAARTGDEATAGLGRTSSGAWSLHLDSAARWWDAVAPIGRFFDFVVTDWGAPQALDDVRAASTVVLVVTAASRDGLRAGVDLRARLDRSGLTALLAVHDTGGAPRGLAEAARVNGAGWVPADKGLDEFDQRTGGLDKLDQRGRGLDKRERGLDKLDQRGQALDGRGRALDRRTPRLRYRTTTAVLELAARVVDAAAPTRTEAAG